MFEKPVTFVIGAGASCEMGLPSGATLKNNICSVLMPSNENAFGFANEDFIDEIRHLSEGNQTYLPTVYKPFQRAASAIRAGLPWAPSIDNYLYTKHDDPDILTLAKAAIAYDILKAEHSSHLMVSNPHARYPSTRRTPGLSNPKINESWYPRFAELLLSQTRPNDIKDKMKRVRFVVFNYDRCLEQFLWLVLQQYFGFDGEESADMLSGVEFIHPYGDLGPLPWQDVANGVEFGAHRDLRGNAVEIGRRLMTFTESVESETGMRVRGAMAEAETLVFLGFGFLRQNIDLLGGDVRNADTIIATAYGISPTDHDVIVNTLRGFRRIRVVAEPRIEPGSCTDLFKNYGLTLAAR